MKVVTSISYLNAKDIKSGGMTLHYTNLLYGVDVKFVLYHSGAFYNIQGVNHKFSSLMKLENYLSDKISHLCDKNGEQVLGINKENGNNIPEINRRFNQSRQKNIVIIDTETTGLEDYSEVVQLSAITGEGEDIMNTLVRPFGAISSSASAIHGIYDHMVKRESTPTIVHVVLTLLRSIQSLYPKGDFQLVGYNIPFDIKMILQSLVIAEENLSLPDNYTLSEMEKNELSSSVALLTEFIVLSAKTARCIMREYQEFSGNYRWVKLVDASKACGVLVQNAHDAKGDCLMTLGVMNFIDS